MPNGSSSSSICGASANARAMPTRCCMPCDSSAGLRAQRVAEADQLEIVRGERRALLLRQLAAAPGRRRARTLSSAVSQGSRHGAWNTTPRSGPGPSTSVPARMTRPASAVLQAGDHRQHRRLAAAGVADQADELAGLERQGEVLHDDEAAGAVRRRVGLGEPFEGQAGPHASPISAAIRSTVAAMVGATGPARAPPAGRGPRTRAGSRSPTRGCA